jgi:hypothetical protein
MRLLRSIAALLFMAGIASAFSSSCAMALGDFEVDPECSNDNAASCGDTCVSCAPNQGCDKGRCVRGVQLGEDCGNGVGCVRGLACYDRPGGLDAECILRECDEARKHQLECCSKLPLAQRSFCMAQVENLDWDGISRAECAPFKDKCAFAGAGT